MNYYKIGQKIREIRREKGLSQEELAEKINISTTHMSHIETGHTKLSLQVFLDIAVALEVGANALCDDQLPINPNEVSIEISKIIKNCNSKEAKIILDTVMALQKSMKEYL